MAAVTIRHLKRRNKEQQKTHRCLLDGWVFELFCSANAIVSGFVILDSMILLYVVVRPVCLPDVVCYRASLLVVLCLEACFARALAHSFVLFCVCLVCFGLVSSEPVGSQRYW